MDHLLSKENRALVWSDSLNYNYLLKSSFNKSYIVFSDREIREEIFEN